ncbi:exportin 1 [Gracilaria domingensis]|nr:exportin 1 [Gracilaria domingensis]
MERLADPSIPDEEYVTLLEQPINILYNSRNASERNAAQALLTQLQDMPNAWVRVDKVLDHPSSSINAKFFALQILEKLIRYRWKTLPRSTCESIRNYVVNKVIRLSETDESLRRERVFVSKLNLILVQIVKQEWPAKWQSFMTEIVGASRSSVSLCENNMKILRLLSEEVFEFSTGQMTHDKIQELKKQFNDDFARVFQLCQYVFESANDLQTSRPALLIATLKTLEKFLSWIPLGYIFETQLIELLVGFMGVPSLRNATIPCLVEIASLSSVGPKNYDERFGLLFLSFVKQLVVVLPRDTDIARAYEDADDETQGFVMDLALFFTGFFKSHTRLLNVEGPPDVQEALRLAHEYLVNLSRVSNVEVFKTCLEWWSRLALDLYETECHSSPRHDRASALMLERSPEVQTTALVTLALNPNGIPRSALRLSAKRAFYAPILAELRQVMISRMAKPEEVLIVEDENGEIVRETTKDTDAIALYKTMRETLVYLTHLDTQNTENIMLSKLSAQIDNSQWSWHNLNTLCWAIGSISGAMGEEEERKFLVTVVKELLQLCEIKRGKDNKAVVASNILYVVGQYPRFLRAHWKFLKTVVNKLFEFMHETHPGVQDMACDTFLKIAQKCRNKFVNVQSGETEPFIVEMLDKLPEIIQKLEPHQIHSFYESCGCIIASEVDPGRQSQLIMKLFELPNSSWRQLLYSASFSEEILTQRDKMKNFSSILRTNSRVAESLGPPYLVQLEWIFADMMKVYKAYSSLIQTAVANGGQFATKSALVRNMRAVKREVLRVLETCIRKSDEKNREKIQKGIIEQLTDPILGDYYNSAPDAREPAVLSLFSTIVTYMQGTLTTSAITVIFKSLVRVTVDMITNNFEDFPDARINFFLLLRSINQHNFAALFALSENPAAAEADFRFVINAIVWAFKHTERNVAETGLQILIEMLRKVDSSPFVNYFYRIYFKLILNDILSVLTDTFHRPGFKLHAMTLMHLIGAVGSGRITEPIWDEAEQDQVACATANGTAPASNPVFLHNHLLKILKEAFPNLTETQVTEIVKKLLSSVDEKMFKIHLRDFLVQTKEFSSGDNTELFDEENKLQQLEKEKLEKERLARTPGLLPPSRVQSH